MDFAKKRKADDNGGSYPIPPDSANTDGGLSSQDIEKILDPFTKEQLLQILRPAVVRHPDVLEAVRAVADADPAQRKLFVRGLGWETTTEKLRQVFAASGELDESNTIVITDKATGKSKGYGFVTYKHIDGALLALKEPNKKIDGRITVTQLAAAGNSNNSNSADLALRKIYVGNIPFEVSSERLLAYFSTYGEIQEGPLGFDKQTGKARGFAFFVYRTGEGARAALAEPLKIVDGHQVLCKLATDNNKNKKLTGPMGMPGDGMPQSNYNFGGYAGYGSGTTMSQLPQAGMMHKNTSFSTAMGPGGPGGRGFSGGYGLGASQLGSGLSTAGPGEYAGGLANAGGYRPNVVGGMQGPGRHMDGGNYGVQSAYPGQNLPGTGPGPRLPTYQGVPPYY